MQTFLPYPSFIKSAECLDYRRLGKQRVEAKQILDTLKYGSRWKNHPAVKMWEGYEEALALYHDIIISEWIRRGYNNNMQYNWGYSIQTIMPHWFGNYDFHASHRSNLLRKNYEFYSKYGWKEPDTLDYVWPCGRSAIGGASGLENRSRKA